MLAMLRFLAGTLLVQAASVALVIVAGAEARDWETWLPIAVALGVIGLIAAFWFTTVATNLRRDKLDRQRADFARERENLRVKAEREKTRLVRKGQKDIASETRRAESRANRKVALAMAAAGVFPSTSTQYAFSCASSTVGRGEAPATSVAALFCPASSAAPASRSASRICAPLPNPTLVSSA